MGMAAVVRHREDSYEIVGGPVDEAVGIYFEDVAAGPRFIARPSERRREDLLDGMVEVCEEALLGGGALIPIPVAGFLDLSGGFGVENQSRGHGVRA
jgi:hypothetical protein